MTERKEPPHAFIPDCNVPHSSRKTKSTGLPHSSVLLDYEDFDDFDENATEAMQDDEMNDVVATSATTLHSLPIILSCFSVSEDRISKKDFTSPAFHVSRNINKMDASKPISVARQEAGSMFVTTDLLKSFDLNLSSKFDHEPVTDGLMRTDGTASAQTKSNFNTWFDGPMKVQNMDDDHETMKQQRDDAEAIQRGVFTNEEKGKEPCKGKDEKNEVNKDSSDRPTEIWIMEDCVMENCEAAALPTGPNVMTTDFLELLDKDCPIAWEYKYRLMNGLMATTQAIPQPPQPNFQICWMTTTMCGDATASQTARNDNTPNQE